MDNLSKLVGAAIQDPLGIEQGINYFLDYLIQTQYSELGAFYGGLFDNSKPVSDLTSNPYFLRFSRSYQINPKKQAVFQDSLGQVFIEDKEFPKRNKTLILEIQNFSENTNQGIIQTLSNPESINASNIIYKNRNSNQ